LVLDESEMARLHVGFKMKYGLCELLIVLLVLLLISPSFVWADGMYRIGEDAGGMYMDTDEDGSWYIDRSHAQYFSVGEKGGYTLSTDQNGVFIKTSKGGKFYIDKKALDRRELEIEAFNKKQRQAQATETRVVMPDGSQVLVPVTLGYQGKEVEVLLLLDTGSTITVLHREVADSLKLKSIQKAKLMVTGGAALDADIVKLDYVEVGPIKKEGLHASVIHHEGLEVTYKGLLGMNFLEGLGYRIDSARRVIRWE
jgi:clan AA aspartic protease (TIGR02281 family)